MSSRSEHTDTHRRSIPAAIDAERAVLGSILLDPDAFVKLGRTLQPGDFFRESHGKLYETLQQMNERRDPIDFVTLTEALERRSLLGDIGGPAYLTGLVADIPTALYIDHYARIVADAAARRRLISAAGKIAEIAYEEETDVSEAIDKAEQIVFGIGENRIRNDFKPVRAVMSQVIERIDFLSRNQGQASGVPTGFTMLDGMLGGLQKTDLIILAARPGVGKTSFSTGIGYGAAKRHGLNVAFISLEMSSEQLTNRILSMETGIDSHRLKSGKVHDEEWPIVMEAADVVSRCGLFIEDTPAATMADIRTKCRRLHAEHALDLIIVDYLQLIKGSGEQRHLELSQITKALKALARELHLPVMVLSQLSRALESRHDKRPMLSDLRESGAIEEDADVVMFIYRDDYYDEDTERQNIADIIVAKHRNGSTGTVQLYFRKELTQFRDLEITRTEIY